LFDYLHCEILRALLHVRCERPQLALPISSPRA